MELFYADLSPYARKVRVVIEEKGLSDRVTQTIVNPYETPERLLAVNPLCKVPTLVLDDGRSLYDSPVICEYLDAIGDGPPLLPPEPPVRLEVLRRSALADGMLDAAFNVSCERNRREAHERSQRWVDRWVASITRGVDALEREIEDWPAALDMAQVGAGCALAYLDIRLQDLLRWRDGHPRAAAWFQDFARRASMVRSAPAP